MMMNHQRLVYTVYTVRSRFKGKKPCLMRSRFLSSSTTTRKSPRTRRLSSSTTTASSAEKVAAAAHLVAKSEKQDLHNSSILPLKFVLSPMVKAILPVIGNISYLAVASGFLMTDMLQLRVALVGGYSGLVMFHMMHPKPLRIPLRWSALFILLNAGAACALAADRYAAPFSQDDEQLYAQHFSALTRGQFHQLLSLGMREDLPDGQVLTEEDSICQYVYFIEKGKAKVYHHQAFAANIDQGGFVNDLAFGRGENVGAYGTVVTSGECSVIKWDQSTLRNHLMSRPEMDRNMKYCLSDHLVKSLLRQREAAHVRQRQGWSGGGEVSTVPLQQRRKRGTIRRSPSEREITWDEHKKSIDTAPVVSTTENIAAVSPQDR